MPRSSSNLLALERESPAIGLVNRKIVQLGGEPIPLSERGTGSCEAEARHELIGESQPPTRK